MSKIGRIGIVSKYQFLERSLVKHFRMSDAGATVIGRTLSTPDGDVLAYSNLRYAITLNRFGAPIVPLGCWHSKQCVDCFFFSNLCTAQFVVRSFRTALALCHQRGLPRCLVK